MKAYYRSALTLIPRVKSQRHFYEKCTFISCRSPNVALPPLQPKAHVNHRSHFYGNMAVVWARKKICDFLEDSLKGMQPSPDGRFPLEERLQKNERPFRYSLKRPHISESQGSAQLSCNLISAESSHGASAIETVIILVCVVHCHFCGATDIFVGAFDSTGNHLFRVTFSETSNPQGE